MTKTTFVAHRATIVLMAVVVVVATGDGFAQSYAGLYRWAIEHHLSEWKAMSFPLLVDLFIAVGELGLFALALEGHRFRKAVMAWADVALPFGIALAGWSVSLVFNVGAVGRELSDQATAAVAPVASMLGLLVLLRTLHRLVTRERPASATSPVVTLRPVAEPDDDDDEQVADLRPKVAEPPVEVEATDDEAIVLAWATGVSQRKIAKQAGLTRHEVADIIKAAKKVAEPPTFEPVEPSLNGHGAPA